MERINKQDLNLIPYTLRQSTMEIGVHTNAEERVRGLADRWSKMRHVQWSGTPVILCHEAVPVFVAYAPLYPPILSAFLAWHAMRQSDAQYVIDPVLHWTVCLTWDNLSGCSVG